jgi:hypothetical protein
VWTTYVELNVLGQGDGDAVRVNDVRIEPCVRGGGGGGGGVVVPF